MMRNTLIVIMLSMLAMQSARAGESATPRFSYGLEWGALVTIYHWDSATYNADEGFLATDYDDGFDYHANGMVAGRIGVDFSHLSASVLAGWQGFGRNHRAFPIWLRSDWHMSGTDKDGTFIRMEGGLAVPERRHEKTTWLAGAGVGRRMIIAGRFSMDVTLSVQPCVLHPSELYDDYSKEYITYDRIRTAKEWWIPVKLAIGLNF